MTTLLNFFAPWSSFTISSRSNVKNKAKKHHIQCIQTGVQKLEEEIERRTANYEPPACSFPFIQSLNSKYGDSKYMERAEELKIYVRKLLESESDAQNSLELVDTIRRLGLARQFEEDIQKVIESRIINHDMEDDLYYTALKFKVLRQEGHVIPQDVFIPFLEGNGDFKQDTTKDPAAALSLYDASYIGMKGEQLMDNARDFTTMKLNEVMNKASPGYLKLYNMIEHGLEIPCYWRTERQEARWFIQECETDKRKDNKLLELAKLEYNISQAIYIKSVQATSRWWNECGIDEHLPFCRSRIPESFLWAHAMVSDPKHSYATEMLTLIIQICTTIDDIFDVYGTVNELELFLSAVKRWDVQALETLPAYIRPCFLVLFNLINEIAYKNPHLQGDDLKVYIHKLFVDHGNTQMQEAKWFHEGYKPTFSEYIENSIISVSGPLMLSCLPILMKHEITKETLALYENMPDFIRASSYALRLNDDLGTTYDEVKRGDVLKAVQCYMHEKKVSQKFAIEHIRNEIKECWKILNTEYLLGTKYPKDLVISSIGNARASAWFYAYGDGYGSERERTLSYFNSSIVNPIDMGDECGI